MELPLEKLKVRLIISGKVQKVAYRWFAVKIAKNMNLKGYAQNNSDGTVIIEAEGEAESLKTLTEKLHRGSLLSEVKNIKIEWLPYKNEFSGFDIKY